jgi:hypothetical protein
VADDCVQGAPDDGLWSHLQRRSPFLLDVLHRGEQIAAGVDGEDAGFGDSFDDWDRVAGPVRVERRAKRALAVNRPWRRAWTSMVVSRFTTGGEPARSRARTSDQ